jgi:lysophospholipase L1-like esterase
MAVRLGTGHNTRKKLGSMRPITTKGWIRTGEIVLARQTIVCFGDSNTWGFDPATSERFPPAVRWPGVLQARLGDGFHVIEEGLNGRTTTVEDPLQPHRNGLVYLPPCLESHKPIDLVTIMLGTNDLKARFRRSGSDIAETAALLAGVARSLPVSRGGAFPRVLLIAPPPIVKLGILAEMFDGGIAKSQKFAEYYRTYAEWYNVDFFDAGSVIRSSEIDGIHLEADQHRRLGEALAGEVNRLLG